MSKVILELLRRFKVELAHPDKEWHVVNRWYVPGSLAALLPSAGPFCRFT